MTDRERDLLVDPGVRRLLSPVSVWEAAIKREAGRLRSPRDLAGTLARQFEPLPVDAALLERAAELPRHHGDPFDRVLVAHALHDGLELLTRDGVLARYGVRLAR